MTASYFSKFNNKWCDGAVAPCVEDQHGQALRAVCLGTEGLFLR